ncbi:MAG: phosphonate ABC transporter, permease protein PhnE [Cyanobacteria bacterium]|nr:phosphonate ABC transporter, permease protein PhnE [Cyanobacteriota bacterium]MDW8203052.1 phosphonate ABC transporter, permease protein PhnE [Cyanobacteriota bacterium SKYGB_h_bin112]
MLNWLGWLLGIVLVVICWQLISNRTHWNFVQDAPTQVGNLLSRAFPPDWRYLPQLWRPLWDTLNIATLGTVMSVLVAVPVAFLAAHNTTPHPWIRQLMLLVIVGSRSVNSLIWAMLLVAMLGPGILAGVIAIGLRSIGFVGKLCYEAIEEINPETVEAIAATGANPLQILTYGIVPQVLPACVGVTIFRWDINMREATVLGLVGAGGIGLQLNASIAVLRWSQVSVILTTIVLLVLISEWLSAQVRQAVT